MIEQIKYTILNFFGAYIKMHGDFINALGSFNVKYSIGCRKIFSTIILSSICILIYYINPKKRIKIASNLQKELKSKLIGGYLCILISILLGLVLVFTIIGIPFIPFLVLSLFILYLVGFTSIALFIGRRITSIFSLRASCVWCIVIGALTYEIIEIIPYIGRGITVFFFTPLALGVVSYKFFNNLLLKVKSYEEDW